MKQKKILRKGMLGIILCFAMVIGLMPGMMMTAYAAEIVIDSSKNSWEQGNTYVLNSDVTILDRIAVYGEATLVLNEGCTLTASRGITVAKDNKLTIRGSGTLVASAETDGTFNNAGIGGLSNQDCGTVIIDGGTIIVNKKGNAAGIGGGLAGNNSGIISGNGGSITINGGTVTVNHPSGSGAGIGGGYGGNGGIITINGGTVTTTGAGGGAGIGGGGRGNEGGGNGEIITINGGTVTATGAGGGAGIGGGNRGAGGTITISDTANVTATGGEAGAGIGTGDKGKTGSITIDDTAQVTATGGELSAGIGGGQYGQIDSISIGGGTVTATGGKGGAGIGGGSAGNNDGYRVDGGTITITGGKVTAIGGDETNSGAGSGAGIGGGWNGACGKVTISGGTVTATGGIKGAGIGSGNYCQFNEKSVITITGGTITAKGGDKSMPGEGSGAGIGGGWNSACGKVTISGGEVNAQSGENGAGIGGQNGAGSEIEISGGTVTATAEGNNSSGISSDQGTTISGGIVTASGSVKAINGTIKNSNGGVGWTNTAGTKGKTFIPISTSGQKLDYLKAQFPGKAADVTFKVVNGSWNDDTSDAKTVLLFGFPNEDLKLAKDQIPAAGDKPNDGYLPGSWDVTPSADTAITSATTYTYTYAQKEAATVKIAPAPNTLTYTGSAQELVTAGEAEGGEMQYALGNATAATEPYTTSIPTATGAGTYYVWYMAVGNTGYTDSEPSYTVAVISEPGKTYCTVTFDVQGHGAAPDDQRVEAGSLAARPADPTAEGYTFGGWYKEAACESLWDFTADHVNANVTLYAQWTAEAPETPGISKTATAALDDSILSDELKEKGFDTVAKVKEEFVKQLRVDLDITNEKADETGIIGTIGGDPNKGFKLGDVTLQVSTDGGKTWRPATAEDVSPEGFATVLPYPEGTNGSDYTFTVAHMVGQKTGTLEAGTIETPPVTNTPEGIQTNFHGLSPVLITWTKKAPEAKAPEKEQASPHKHRMEWKITREATETEEGELAYVCAECGYVEYTVPLSAYYVFQQNAINKIRAAGKNATVEITTDRWISFHRSVADALKERPDVTLSVSFLDDGYRGNRQRFTIPAGSDLLGVFGENNFAGFLYLGGKYGMTPQ